MMHIKLLDDKHSPSFTRYSAISSTANSTWHTRKERGKLKDIIPTWVKQHKSKKLC